MSYKNVIYLKRSLIKIVNHIWNKIRGFCYKKIGKKSILWFLIPKNPNWCFFSFSSGILKTTTEFSKNSNRNSWCPNQFEYQVCCSEGHRTFLSIMCLQFPWYWHMTLQSIYFRFYFEMKRKHIFCVLMNIYFLMRQHHLLSTARSTKIVQEAGHLFCW